MSPSRNSSRRVAFRSASPFAAMSPNPHERAAREGGVCGVFSSLKLSKWRCWRRAGLSESLSQTHDITSALTDTHLRPSAVVPLVREHTTPTCVHPAFCACHVILILLRIKPRYTLYGSPPEALPHPEVSVHLPRPTTVLARWRRRKSPQATLPEDMQPHPSPASRSPKSLPTTPRQRNVCQRYQNRPQPRLKPPLRQNPNPGSPSMKSHRLQKS
jgi:hypothetical protein